LQITRLLMENGVSVRNTADLSGRGAGTYSFLTPGRDYRRVMAILNDCGYSAPRGEILAEKGLAMLSVIGSGIARDPDITAMFYDILLNENIEIHLLSLSEMRISALVYEHAADRAVSCLRARFMEAGVYCPAERTVKGYEKKEDLHRLGSGCDHPFYGKQDRFQII